MNIDVNQLKERVNPVQVTNSTEHPTLIRDRRMNGARS
jgi:hypothetical protein